VNITFQEGESVDLFIGWRNKRDELHGWRVLSASFVELLLYGIMYSCIQNAVSNFKLFLLLNIYTVLILLNQLKGFWRSGIVLNRSKWIDYPFVIYATVIEIWLPFSVFVSCGTFLKQINQNSFSKIRSSRMVKSENMKWNY
jgi:hypothetical protein